MFGEGEQGPARQPRHPHAIALARLLLDAGADPNDGQALYNRMFSPDDDHLELLFAFGLGRGDGGPWRRRLGEALDSPAAMVRGQLSWAVTHGMRARVELLVQHGVDVRTPLSDVRAPLSGGRTPAEAAALSGHLEIVDYLVAHGADAPDPRPVDAFVAAALAGDRRAVEHLLAAYPDAAETAGRDRPGRVVWAAATGRPAAVELLVEHGFDVNALGRADVPVEQPWETALHQAAGEGDVELVRLLLARGADPDIHDSRFDATPLGWAEHFGHDATVELLRPLTTPDTEADAAGGAHGGAHGGGDRPPV